MRHMLLLLILVWYSLPAAAQIAFSERADQAGVADGGVANGAAFGDYNGDGYPDLFVGRLEVGGSSLLYANRGDGQFVDRSAMIGSLGRSMGGVFVDYDGDGDQDLYAVRFNEPNVLLNNEAGQLIPLPDDGLAVGHPGATSAVFADFNGDGALDLYSTHRFSSANQYISDVAGGRLIDVSDEQSALRAGQETFAAVAFDYDGDGDQDIYAANFGFVDLLHRNDGRGAFEQVADGAGLRESGFSVAGLPADYDGDGDFDLYVVRANLQENVLWENLGEGQFERHRVGAEGAKSSAGGVACDFDLDGDIDILVSNLGGVDVYANRGDGHFDDVSLLAVPPSMQFEALTAGVAAADYDADGDVDVFLSGVRGADALLRNEAAPASWLALRLPAGSEGAQVEVFDGTKRQLRQLRVDTQLGSASTGMLHYGVLAGAVIDVDIAWPSGQRYTFRDVPSGQTFSIERPLLDRDLAIVGVRAPSRMPIWGPLRPRVEVANRGIDSALGQVLRLQVSLAGALVYDEQQPLPDMSSGARKEYVFPEFVPLSAGDYRFAFSLEGADDAPANNRWERLVHWHPFVEVAEEMAVDDAGAGWAAAMADSDGDGDIDLYVSNGGSFGAGDNAFYRNDGDRFVNVTELNGTADGGNGTGVVFADFNGDGHEDLFLAKGGFLPPGEPDRLLLNNGDGTFVDRSEAAGLSEAQASYAVAVGDYDADGALDLYVSKFRGQYNALYHNVGGAFVDERRRRRIISYQRFSGGAAAFADFDEDGDTDLYASIFGMYDLFYAEVGDSAYVAAQVGDEGDAVGVAMGDYDADGDFDLYIVNQTWRSALWRNDVSEGQFVDVASQSGVENQGVGTGCAFGDYDNDGDLDLFVTNARGANRVYMNRGDGTFIDVAIALGMVDTVRTRSVLLSDYDNDGDLDPYVVNERHPNRLYRNDGGTAHWLQVRLAGEQSNRNAVGARLTLHAGPRAIYRQVNGTAGMSQSSRIVQFGLGRADRVDSLVLRWPNGRVQRLFPPLDQRIAVIEGNEPTSIEEEASTPQGLELMANYPNPFNAETRIRFAVEERGWVRLVVYNALGQSVRGLLADEIDAGEYELAWDGRDDGGQSLASGVYFSRLFVEGRTRSRPLLMLR